MGFFKGVSSLSLVCLAGNVEALEDDVVGSDDVSLDSESEFSSDEIETASSTMDIKRRSIRNNQEVIFQVSRR